MFDDIFNRLDTNHECDKTDRHRPVAISARSRRAVNVKDQ